MKFLQLFEKFNRKIDENSIIKIWELPYTYPDNYIAINKLTKILYEQYSSYGFQGFFYGEDKLAYKIRNNNKIPLRYFIIEIGSKAKPYVPQKGFKIKYMFIDNILDYYTDDLAFIMDEIKITEQDRKEYEFENDIKNFNL